MGKKKYVLDSDAREKQLEAEIAERQRILTDLRTARAKKQYEAVQPPAYYRTQAQSPYTAVPTEKPRLEPATPEEVNQRYRQLMVQKYPMLDQNQVNVQRLPSRQEFVNPALGTGAAVPREDTRIRSTPEVERAADEAYYHYLMTQPWLKPEPFPTGGG